MPFSFFFLLFLIVFDCQSCLIVNRVRRGGGRVSSPKRYLVTYIKNYLIIVEKYSYSINHLFILLFLLLLPSQNLQPPNPPPKKISSSSIMHPFKFFFSLKFSRFLSLISAPGGHNRHKRHKRHIWIKHI